MKKIFQVVIGLVIAVIIIGAAGAGYLYSLNRETDLHRSVEAPFIIEKGDSLSQIAFELEMQGYIRSQLLFKLISRFKGTENSMKTGVYEIPPGGTTLEIHDFLVKGKQKLVKVTIPEGLTLTKAALYVEDAGIADADSFIDAARNSEVLEKYGIKGADTQGFLYPETYHFPMDFPAEKIVEHMVETFFQKLKDVYPNYRNMSSEELYNKVVIASIVEREYRIVEDAPLIASVFYNRLENNIALGSCATVEYVITEEMGKPHPSFLTYQDLEIESDYNTYILPGLPPGPISNPGKTALTAAFYPAETDYLYFLLQDVESGKHYFSRTYTEHNKAKIVYLKGVSQ